MFSDNNKGIATIITLVLVVFFFSSLVSLVFVVTSNDSFDPRSLASIEQWRFDKTGDPYGKDDDDQRERDEKEYERHEKEESSSKTVDKETTKVVEITTTELTGLHDQYQNCLALGDVCLQERYDFELAYTSFRSYDGNLEGTIPLDIPCPGLSSNNNCSVSFDLITGENLYVYEHYSLEAGEWYSIIVSEKTIGLDYARQTGHFFPDGTEVYFSNDPTKGSVDYTIYTPDTPETGYDVASIQSLEEVKELITQRQMWANMGPEDSYPKAIETIGITGQEYLEFAKKQQQLQNQEPAYPKAIETIGITGQEYSERIITPTKVTKLYDQYQNCKASGGTCGEERYDFETMYAKLRIYDDNLEGTIPLDIHCPGLSSNNDCSVLYDPIIEKNLYVYDHFYNGKWSTTTINQPIFGDATYLFSEDPFKGGVNYDYYYPDTPETGYDVASIQSFEKNRELMIQKLGGINPEDPYPKAADTVGITGLEYLEFVKEKQQLQDQEPTYPELPIEYKEYNKIVKNIIREERQRQALLDPAGWYAKEAILSTYSHPGFSFIEDRLNETYDWDTMTEEEKLYAISNTIYQQIPYTPKSTNVFIQQRTATQTINDLKTYPNIFNPGLQQQLLQEQALLYQLAIEEGRIFDKTNTTLTPYEQYQEQLFTCVNFTELASQIVRDMVPETTIISGSAYAGSSGHAFNLVEINNEVYVLDVTAGSNLTPLEDYITLTSFDIETLNYWPGFSSSKATQELFNQLVGPIQ